MRKTPLEKLNSRKLELPNERYAKIVYFLISKMQRKDDVSYHYSFDVNKMKGKPVIILADHATKEAYKYVLYGYNYTRPNVVIGFQNIFVPVLFKLLLKVGIIPRQLYATDRISIASMLKILKMNGSLLIFPEGIQSTSGSNHPIFAGTAKLIQRAGIPVILCKSYGSYLVRPRYKKENLKGHQEFHYEILFNGDELKTMSLEDIEQRLLERFRYNDFEWNRKKRYKYISKKEPLAKGIDSILYYCPKCHSEHTLRTENNDIVCEKCGNRISLDEYYDLKPKTKDDVLPFSSIDEWFKYQRKLVQEEVKKPFTYQYECDMYDLHTEKLSFKPFYKCGEGTMTITNETMHYQGTRHGETVDLVFDIKNTPSFPFTPNQDNDLYYNNTYYSFRPKENKSLVLKYMLLVEESHRLVDETWDKISKEAYNI